MLFRYVALQVLPLVNRRRLVSRNECNEVILVVMKTGLIGYACTVGVGYSMTG